MIKLNLLPFQEKGIIAAEKNQRWIVFYGSVVLGALCFSVVLMGFTWLYIDIQLKSLSDSLGSIQSSLRGQDLKTQQTAVQKLNMYLEKIDTVQKNQKSYSYLLNSLAKIVPDGIRFDSLSVEENGEATLNGFAQKREQVLIFKDLLEKSTVFSNVESPVSNLTKSTDINFYFRFKIQPDALKK